MRRSLSQLRLLIIDKVSMLSNLNLAYVHLRLDEIFGRDEWFGGVNVLFVGDILQLPPVNGAPVFDRITNKAVASKLGCMTSVNIWQETVVFDELTINERQRKDQAFSSILDEVRRGCPSQQTIQALQDRVIEVPVVDKFEVLLVSKQSPLCLFPTRKACQEFNSQILSRLEAEVIEIPCIDKVDETASTFKWSKKATEEMKKLNSDCNYNYCCHVLYYLVAINSRKIFTTMTVGVNNNIIMWLSKLDAIYVGFSSMEVFPGAQWANGF